MAQRGDFHGHIAVGIAVMKSAECEEPLEHGVRIQKCELGKLRDKRIPFSVVKRDHVRRLMEIVLKKHTADWISQDID